MRYPFEGGAAAADRHRVVMAEMHLLSLAHSGPQPEHAAYLDARGYAHDIVHAWTRYLENLMRDGEVPAQDPHLLARAVIGLCAYPFAWYDRARRCRLSTFVRPSSRTPSGSSSTPPVSSRRTPSKAPKPGFGPSCARQGRMPRRFRGRSSHHASSAGPRPMSRADADRGLSIASAAA